MLRNDPADTFVTEDVIRDESGHLLVAGTRVDLKKYKAPPPAPALKGGYASTIPPVREDGRPV